MFTRIAQVILATRAPEADAVREKIARSGALWLAAEAGKKGAGVKAAAKQAKGSVKRAAGKVMSAAQPALCAVSFSVAQRE
jgi:hypothetical protein